MDKVKIKEIEIKDVFSGVFWILIAVIGFMINQRLASIDESIKEFKSFQREQIQSTEYLKGEINLLKAKDLELEKKMKDN